MKKYVCDVCGWVYDEALGAPDQGIAPGTKFEDIPEDWVCPLISSALSAGWGRTLSPSSKVPIRASGGKHPPEAFFLPLRASY